MIAGSVRDRPVLLSAGFGLLSGCAFQIECWLLFAVMGAPGPAEQEGAMLAMTVLAGASLLATLYLVFAAYEWRTRLLPLAPDRSARAGMSIAALTWCVGLLLILIFGLHVYFWFYNDPAFHRLIPHPPGY